MIDIKKHSKNGSGFDVLHSFGAWKIAFISCAAQYSAPKIMKRHTQTDEAFLLIRGSAILFSQENGEKIQATELEAEKLYVVKKNTWHHLTVSDDALIMVVENSDTTAENTESRLLSEKEKNEIK